mmetsp:Transcript_66501/g.185857  ORF Transcript_66501/g.185857 Transcript_66501/m.185857 type:complete len:316 (-) Transcript_66501:49-996(-)
MRVFEHQVAISRLRTPRRHCCAKGRRERRGATLGRAVVGISWQERPVLQQPATAERQASTAGRRQAASAGGLDGGTLRGAAVPSAAAPELVGGEGPGGCRREAATEDHEQRRELGAGNAQSRGRRCADARAPAGPAAPTAGLSGEALQQRARHPPPLPLGVPRRRVRAPRQLFADHGGRSRRGRQRAARGGRREDRRRWLLRRGRRLRRRVRLRARPGGRHLLPQLAQLGPRGGNSRLARGLDQRVVRPALPKEDAFPRGAVERGESPGQRRRCWSQSSQVVSAKRRRTLTMLRRSMASIGWTPCQRRPPRSAEP